VINYQEQLQPGTFEHAVHYLIEHKLDLSVFHPKVRNDDNITKAKKSTAIACRWWSPWKLYCLVHNIEKLALVNSK
tara:strand:- start:40 stop:267 length:228 start_codon:yes stop_codon:yes gene_type:complete